MNHLTNSQELELRVEADGVAINKLFTRITALESALAKQRALNEELFAWFESDCDSEVSESLVAAFVEVLK